MNWCVADVQGGLAKARRPPNPNCGNHYHSQVWRGWGRYLSHCTKFSPEGSWTENLKQRKKKVPYFLPPVTWASSIVLRSDSVSLIKYDIRGSWGSPSRLRAHRCSCSSTCPPDSHLMCSYISQQLTLCGCPCHPFTSVLDLPDSLSLVLFCNWVSYSSARLAIYYVAKNDPAQTPDPPASPSQVLGSQVCHCAWLPFKS